MFRNFLVAFLICLTATGAALASDGNRLLLSCEQFLEDVSDAGGGQLLMRKDYDSGYCFGSMIMLQGLGNISFTDGSGPALSFCAPESVKASQFARIVTHYLHSNPQS